MAIMEKITENNKSQIVEYDTMQDFCKANIKRMSRIEKIPGEFEYDFQYIQRYDDLYIIRTQNVADFHPCPTSRSMFGKIAISDPNSDLLHNDRFMIEHEYLHSLDDIMKKASVWVPFTFIIDEGLYPLVRHDKENAMCKTLDIEPSFDEGDFSKEYVGVIYATEDMVKQYCGNDMSNIESQIIDRLVRDIEWYDTHALSKLYNISKCQILKNEDGTVSLGDEKHLEKVFMTDDEFKAHVSSEYKLDFYEIHDYHHWEDEYDNS